MKRDREESREDSLRLNTGGSLPCKQANPSLTWTENGLYSEVAAKEGGKERKVEDKNGPDAIHEYEEWWNTECHELMGTKSGRVTRC
jgi:hypothetical protein